MINERHADDVISLALEQKLEFDAGLERRDKLVNRFLCPDTEWFTRLVSSMRTSQPTLRQTNHQVSQRNRVLFTVF